MEGQSGFGLGARSRSQVEISGCFTSQNWDLVLTKPSDAIPEGQGVLLTAGQCQRFQERYALIGAGASLCAEPDKCDHANFSLPSPGLAATRHYPRFQPQH